MFKPEYLIIDVDGVMTTGQFSILKKGKFLRFLVQMIMTR